MITLPTTFRRGRFVTACYHEMNLAECIASDTDDYVTRAVELGNNPDRRRVVSREIAERREVLFQNQNCVSEFEEALRKMLS